MRTITSQDAEKEDPVEPHPFRLPSNGQLVNEDDATKGGTGDRVSSITSADKRRLRRSFDDTSNGPFSSRVVLHFFLPDGIPNSEQVASHARSSKHSKTTGDIIGDSFSLLLHSLFLPSLSSLSAVVT